VAISGVSAQAPDTAFDVEYFKFNKTVDSYTCPAKETLTSNRNWYAKKNGKSITKIKYYKTSNSVNCKLFTECTKNAKGRLIKRYQNSHSIYQNKVRIENNYEIYRGR
jgi:hypothetical protein